MRGGVLRAHVDHQAPGAGAVARLVGGGSDPPPHPGLDFYEAILSEGSRVSEIYGGATRISERHRHRYEVNVNYKDRLEAVGLRFSGMSPDGELPEIVEIPEHPWFVGVQYHPELKSKPFVKRCLESKLSGKTKKFKTVKLGKL